MLKTIASAMKKNLEFKVLAVVTTLLIIGVISASLIALSIQKTTLYSITELSTEKAADIIFRDIETTMIQNRADLTKEIVENISKSRGIEAITVLNSEGREAFKKDSPAREAIALGELKSGKERLLRQERSRLTFYMPLKNVLSCRGCHGADTPVLGAVKVSISIENEYKRAMKLILIVIVLTVVAALLFSFVLWMMLRKMVIRPVKSIEAAAGGIAQGDLSFNVESTSDDEIGRVSKLLKESFMALEGVLQRINELSSRILNVVEDVEVESEKVIRGAESEAVATDSISSSVEQLNATAAGVAENTEGLAASAEDASASIEEMASSIKSINGSIQELNGIVESTSASIEQLSATIREVANNAEDLTGASAETLSAISQITAAIREVDTSATESAKLSEKATSEASTLGKASIEKTIEGMKVIESCVMNTAGYVDQLGNRSKEIEMILSVIQEVTDETTLLSLNAAILAAQAGEQGNGFSVVANEIKALAKRTETSTKEITALIQAVQREVGNAASAMEDGISAVSTGLKLSQDAGEALGRVLDSSKRSSEMTSSIKRNTEEQAHAANLVLEATDRVRNMIDHIAKATAEQSQGVVLVMQAAEKMKDLSRQVSRATEEQTLSSRHIAQATETVSERSRQISKSLMEHKKGSQSILLSVEEVKNIPVENRRLAFRISKTLWNLQKDAELLKAEMERFRFSGKSGQSLRFGVVPLQEPSVMFRKFTPLSEYLAKKLDRKVDLRVAIDMESAVDDIGKNITQLCAMGPANYVEAHKRYGVNVIVKALRQGKPYHRAAIIVRADSGIKRVSDLRGKTFAFVSPKSATGHIAPLATLKDAGIMVDALRSYEFLGSHDKVAEAVLNGAIDGGGLMEETAQQFEGKGLRILQFSPEIPEFNICRNASVAEETANAIRDALVNLDVSKAEDAGVLRSLGKDCTGFISASESDYDVFREKMMGLDIEVSAEDYRHRKRR